MLTDLLRQQISAFASMPVSAARLLAALADAAEASVGVLQQLDERATATNRVLHSFEDPLVRLAEAVDTSLVDSTVEALGRLPNMLARASTLTDRADGLMSGLEAIPGLIRMPDTENEMRLLRETLDRVYRVIDEVQGRFGALPGAGLLLRRGQSEAVEVVGLAPVAEQPSPARRKTGKKSNSKSTAKDGGT